MTVNHLNHNFLIEAKFYSNEDILCRSHLTIEKLNSTPEVNNILVVMMNPGRSNPINATKNSLGFTETDPDKTQFQIMSLMIRLNIEKADVINLLDIREPKSKDLLKKCKELDNDSKYSIFSESRAEELELIIKETKIILCAWGVSPGLGKFAKLALKRFSNKIIIGNKRGDEDLKFYHPLPRNKVAQENWLNSIEKKFIGIITKGN